MKHLIKIDSAGHGVVSVQHKGLDSQYCEAGETVKIKWQPTAGWGLQEVHYTDGGGNVVAIEGGEFTMPDSAIVIGATFKRFYLKDWADTPYDPKPKPKYLTFTAGAGGASVGFIVFNDGYDIPETYTKPSLQYSTDSGKTWQDYDLQISDDTANANVIELAEGTSVMFKGVNENLAYYFENDDDWFYMKAYIDGNVAANGDVTSLLNGVGGDATVKQCCYARMFEYCTGLTSAPALPATTLSDNCYANMFYGCTGLTSAPALPATTLATSCYAYMFEDCTGLTTAPVLPATILAAHCYDSMFRDCTGLTEAPVLPATTLSDKCYTSMFSNCTAITSYDVATLNDSTNVFNNNLSCSSLTIHADTPPTIADDTIVGLPADCAIYVPSASVDAYKAAEYWSDRAAYIQPIE